MRTCLFSLLLFASVFSLSAQSLEPYVQRTNALLLSAMPDSGIVFVTGNISTGLPTRVTSVRYPSGGSTGLSYANRRYEDPRFTYLSDGQLFGFRNSRSAYFDLVPDSIRIYRLSSLTYKQIFVTAPSSRSTISRSFYPACAAKTPGTSFYMKDYSAAGFFRESDGFSIEFPTTFNESGYAETVTPSAASIVGEGVLVWARQSDFSVAEYDLAGAVIESYSYSGIYQGAWTDVTTVYYFTTIGYYTHGNTNLIPYPAAIGTINKMFRSGEVATVRAQDGSIYSFSEANGWGQVAESDCSDLLSVIKQEEGWYALYSSNNGSINYPSALYFNPDAIGTLIRNPVRITNVVDSATVSFGCRQFGQGGPYFLIAGVKVSGTVSVQNSIQDTVFSSVTVLANTQSRYNLGWYSHSRNKELVFENLQYDSTYSQPYEVSGEFSYTEDNLDTLLGVLAFVQYVDDKPILFETRSKTEERFIARDISPDISELPCRTAGPTNSTELPSFDDFTVWPNPTSGNVSFRCPIAITKIEIYDFTGREPRFKFRSVPTRELSFTTDLPAGMYILVLSDEDSNELQTTLLIR